MKLAMLACVVLFFTLSCALPSPNDWDNGSGNDAAKRESPCTPTPELVNKCKEEPGKGDDSAVAWFHTCIVQYYCFKQGDPTKAEWTKQPNFKGEMDTENFKRATKVAQTFFLGKKWNGQQGLVRTWKPKDNCNKLLYITAARYLYVTALLYEESDKQIAPCEEIGEKVKMPATVCFKEPVGSKTCTSDYDASLAGAKSGELVGKFNKRFKEIFKLPSEEVFDTNIYAFSLEYSIPSMFIGLLDTFKKDVEKMEANVKYQIQDVVWALYKIKKYDTIEYDELCKAFLKILTKEKLKIFKSWVWLVDTYDDKIVKITNNVNLRKEHDDIYSDLLSQISSSTDSDDFASSYLTQLMLSHLYAAEAYHCRGTMRYIVGWKQAESQEVKKTLTLSDLWTTMLENWGDTMKEYGHCKGDKSEVCLVKMSKYMTRTFGVMEEILAVLGVEDLKDVSPAEKKVSNWLTNIKKVGKPSIENEKEITDFFKVFECPKTDKMGSEISRGCMDKMFAVIRAYTYKLVEKLEKSKISDLVETKLKTKLKKGN